LRDNNFLRLKKLLSRKKKIMSRSFLNSGTLIVNFIRSKKLFLLLCASLAAIVAFVLHASPLLLWNLWINL
jgi:hypothetical protein